MNEKEFYKWLKGFLESKDKLTEFEVLLIKHKMESYVIVDNLTNQSSININRYNCKFPNECGLNGFNITPSICNKCGYIQPNSNISY